MITRGRSADGRVFVDTGAYYALTSDEDEYYTESVRLMRALSEGRYQLVTTQIIIAEAHTLIRTRLRTHGRKHALAIAREVLARILRSDVVIEPITNADAEQAIATLFAYPDQEISYTDAISFAVMRRLGIAHVFSFDDDFAVAGFTNIRHVL
jgi:predicted nucleic acid-binding protein